MWFGVGRTTVGIEVRIVTIVMKINDGKRMKMYEDVERARVYVY